MGIVRRYETGHFISAAYREGDGERAVAFEIHGSDGLANITGRVLSDGTMYWQTAREALYFSPDETDRLAEMLRDVWEEARKMTPGTHENYATPLADARL